MKTIFTKGFQGKAIAPAGGQVPVMQVQPTFGGQGGVQPQAQRGMAAPQAPAVALPGRTPVPVIKKGSGGPSCPVCRG